jgi:hypothetical protein
MASTNQNQPFVLKEIEFMRTALIASLSLILFTPAHASTSLQEFTGQWSRCEVVGTVPFAVSPLSNVSKIHFSASAGILRAVFHDEAGQDLSDDFMIQPYRTWNIKKAGASSICGTGTRNERSTLLEGVLSKNVHDSLPEGSACAYGDTKIQMYLSVDMELTGIEVLTIETYIPQIDLRGRASRVSSQEYERRVRTAPFISLSRMVCRK